ncbi:MAG: hypothetical protein HFF43_05620 [Lawsonibacter sp.]|nr:hypothetical protein [Lawsonibacter sp.]
MNQILSTLFLDNPYIPEQVCTFCGSLPEFREAERAYWAAERELESRLEYEIFNHFDEAQSRYMAHLAKAYYLFGLGLRQEVLSALGS